ncbi:MAG: tRNA (adenosine(37)-N6)-threonylcarbamoyltransferase complex ATPase subunit type 1 TsaE [Elusimicrobiota bacterium]|jgi:tRNA threonylcarbamoyladenosine biosynthesis protein TsaE|nr:tRNA (adenosine(37)-N6)-threonylcarbamoyltransferase complex ATPase subunit type 1 TsaE [Elusimicrobiota bacterium]
MKKLVCSTSSPRGTEALAKNLAALLAGGEIIFFNGPIGAGKTVMVSALARFFGFKKRPVSASFSLMKKYQNKNATIYHIDLFRLESAEMFNLGYEEMLEDESAIILAEWPQAAAGFFGKERLEIDIKLKTGDKRRITFKARGKKYEDILENLWQKTK